LLYSYKTTNTDEVWGLERDLELDAWGVRHEEVDQRPDGARRNDLRLVVGVNREIAEGAGRVLEDGELGGHEELYQRLQRPELRDFHFVVLVDGEVAEGDASVFVEPCAPRPQQLCAAPAPASVLLLLYQ
jgi:hypothetical protein